MTTVYTITYRRHAFHIERPWLVLATEPKRGERAVGRYKTQADALRTVNHLRKQK
jgi:hypothetical protein